MYEDCKEWSSYGLRCFIRHGAFNAPCGYVAVPKDHPLYGKGVEDDVVAVLPAYGGVTYSSKDPCSDEWIFGFDMAHYMDFDQSNDFICIRTDEECENETNVLAKALHLISIVE